MIHTDGTPTIASAPPRYAARPKQETRAETVARIRRAFAPPPKGRRER
jgi:hypothetical protein